MTGGPIYLDNAATSWPKPLCVTEAMASFLAHSAGNPGRGGHRLAREAQAVVERARHALAAVIGASEPKRVVLTHGCTDSVNMAIHGVLAAALCPSEVASRSGQSAGTARPRVVVSCLEHNAVLRTLHAHDVAGEIELVVIPCDERGVVAPAAMLDACDNRTILVCLTHASNALGTIQDVAAVGRGLRLRSPDALFLVDAAQTVGHLPIDVGTMGIDLLSVAGHKGLRGPTGTGCLYVSPRAFPDDGPPRVFCNRLGGTGAVGLGLDMPRELPDALEAGTTNAVGFAGLLAAMERRSSHDHHAEHERTRELLAGLQSISGVRTYGLPTTAGRTAVVMFAIEGLHPRHAAASLDRDHDVAVRAGMHCAPLLHEQLGTAPDGAIRASPGPDTPPEHVATFLSLVNDLARTARVASVPA